MTGRSHSSEEQRGDSIKNTAGAPDWPTDNNKHCPPTFLLLLCWGGVDVVGGLGLVLSDGALEEVEGHR